MLTELQEQLRKMADDKYRTFSAKLTPGAKNIIGVRIPLLRKTAKKGAVKLREFLNQTTDDTFEEIMLQGMAIGMSNISPDELYQHIANFIPKIDNWSVCDIFCGELKKTADDRERLWAFISPYLFADGEFYVRFALVMILKYFTTEEYIKKSLSAADSVKHNGYYAKMAAAWVISECYAKYPQETLKNLQHAQTDKFTFNKALQKITESLRVSPEEKILLNAMRRK